MNKFIEELLNSVAAIDVETTGINFNDDEILQMGVVLPGEDFKMKVCLYDCDKEITPFISSINNITKEMVTGHRKFSVENNMLNDLPTNVKYLVAHNAPFDSKMIAKYGVDKDVMWICTQRVAQKLFQGDTSFDNFKLNYLRYRLGVEVPNMRTHDAGFDALLSAKIFERMLEVLVEMGVDSEERFIEWYTSTIEITIMPFGKHKGKKLIDIPLDYWQWAVQNMEILDEDSEKYDEDFSASVFKALDYHINQG